MPVITPIFCDPAGVCGLDNSLRASCDGASYVGSISGNCSAILGGIVSGAPTNSNASDLSVILMGDHSQINTNTFGGGGPFNGCFNMVANGFCNVASGYFANIFSGQCNVACGCNLNVAGSCNHVQSSLGAVSSSSIFGGMCNTICDNGTVTADSSAISGGHNNCIFAPESFIGAGAGNTIAGLASQSSIAGGNSNTIITPVMGGFTATNSFLGGGASNTIAATPMNSGNYGVLTGGFMNNIAGSDFATLSGGASNQIDQSIATVIGGGQSNKIRNGATTSVIAGGNQNCTSAIASFIGGGTRNVICPAAMSHANRSFIGGGETNFICNGDHNTIVGGISNSIIGISASFVGGGDSNNIFDNTCCSFVGGGYLNTIGTATANPCASLANVITGGQANCIDVGTTAGSESCFSIVGGGCGNTVCAGAHYGSIFSGQANTVCCSYSSILGGSGNSDGGFCYVGIFGCNITGQVGCAFHANNFVARGMSSAVPASGSGILYYVVCSPLACAVYIA